MAVELSTLVRGASGVLFVLLGSACLVLARRPSADRVLAWGLASFALGFGLAFVLVNVSALTDGRHIVPLTRAAPAAWTLAAVGISIVAWRAIRGSGRAGPWLVGVGLLYFVAAAAPLVLEFPRYAATAQVPPEALAPAYASQLLLRFITGTALAAAYAYALAAARSSAMAGPLLMSLGLGIYPAAVHGFVLNTSIFATAAIPQVVNTPLVLGLSLLLLVLAERGMGRPAVGAAVVLCAVTLGGMVEGALEPEGLRRYALGLVRSVAVALLALAVFRHDVLRARLGLRAADRASRATLGLATLLVVAQVAQNYFSATYGLLLGGVIAGAFLFAAAPLQRALEARGAGGEDRLASYREAARYALRDGVLTRKEETHLARLAEHLGIGAADALRIRHEVEDERK